MGGWVGEWVGGWVSRGFVQPFTQGRGGGMAIWGLYLQTLC